MKLKKVAALCKAAGVYQLQDELDATGEVVRQWLGDGNALYPLDGLPYLDEERLRLILDVPTKKWDDVVYLDTTLDPRINLSDVVAEESMAEQSRVGITWRGEHLTALRHGGLVTLIRDKYLVPLEDELNLELYVRKMDGDKRRYVAIKSGLMLIGIILPLREAEEDLQTELSGIVAALKNTIGGR